MSTGKRVNSEEMSVCELQKFLKDRAIIFCPPNPGKTGDQHIYMYVSRVHLTLLTMHMIKCDYWYVYL